MAVTFLLLSIALNTAVNLIFRWFKVFEINKLHAIVVNYLICFLVGLSISNERDILGYIDQHWFLYSLLLGVLFISIFYLMALTTEKLGVSVNAVSNKMSVVIPVSFALIVAKESFSLLFLVGIIISLASIYLISGKKNMRIERKYYALPVGVFLGGGFIDTSLKLLETNFASEVELSTITYTIFLGAFITGLFIVLLSGLNRNKLSAKNGLAGIVLGVPNFFSVFFLLKAIEAFSLKSAFVFGINNVSIVLVSTVLSIVIFKEQLSRFNRIGLILAIVSIIIIAYAS